MMHPASSGSAPSAAVIVLVLTFALFHLATGVRADESSRSLLRPSYEPEVGKPHPDVILQTIEHDRAISLSQFRGKKVLLIHFASW